ncbi:MAG TPA: c-type cytochrome biogenesis protein CcmI [Pyrinomonadaceae bacterium]|jgi:cytochrome c-type biogenesis protein CcmH|nr:c-type cytochrome biogenesis protein CcmI [Pyrinomonadaceae bacterium]
MILYWVICAGMIMIALAFVLPPLLQRTDGSDGESSDRERKDANVAIYRDQLRELKGDLDNGIVSEQQFDLDREEIERRLLEDTVSRTKGSKATNEGSRVTASILAMAISLIAIVFELKIGTPPSNAGPASTTAESPRPERTSQQIAANVDKLAEKLKANPSDLSGWVMLAKSYSSMERFGEAAGAYAKATELDPKNADLWAEYAFVTAMAGNRKIDGSAMELVNHALKVDPENAKALQLAGTNAFDAKDYKKAIELWQRVLIKVPPNSEVAQAITERIDEAKKLSGTK